MSGNANLFALFEERFRQASDSPAFSQPGRAPVTYGALLTLVGRYANALRELSVETGDRVTVQVEKSIANVALYLAVMKVGAVYQPLNTAYTAAEVDYFVGDAEPRLIVTDPSRRAAMEDLADRRGVGAVETLDAEGGGSLAEFAADQPSTADTAFRDPDDLAGLLYTSGTTGRSKGAMLTHRNLSSNAVTLKDLWGFEPGDVLLHALPIFHVHGLYVALNTAFLNTSEIIWLPKFDAAQVVAELPRATVMMGVPTFYTRLLNEPRFTAEAARHMRLFISGSAPLLAETHREFEQRVGHRILERYGMTECGMITSNPYLGDRLAGTVGFALPGVEVRIADKEGHALAAGEVGMLETNGPNRFKGYWRMPEKTAEEIRPDGFFITGDLAVMDEAGRVTIVGRGKDLIISGGFNVYPKEIESLLDELPGIGESAVIGVPHPDFGEAVIAVVTPKTGEAVSESELITSLSERLAKFKVPKRIFTMDELPRNTMGKVQKAELRRVHDTLFRKV
ncbi:malonyl-CoA/methylmalonyl-CoA synthetase [Rhodoligotrophos appendicifer]|uniref:malonate--CoA ligase n=1 Tax=Rhodoligotrophos appendicifer TaxID=987056 RepID=UPI001186B982|nr:malonyl-CoA synthase [Rhodoligotrophos appendicifer]